MKNWKLILPLMMSGSLIACTSTQTTQEPVEPESPKVEEPVKVEPEVKPDVEKAVVHCIVEYLNNSNTTE